MTRIVLALALGFTALAAFAAPIPKDKLPAPTEKQLEESQNNLKQIGIAIHVLMGDGSVMAGVGSKMDADEFRKLITKSDGMTQDTDLALGIEKKK